MVVHTPVRACNPRRGRQVTAMRGKWIADRLEMGTWSHVTDWPYRVKN